jgi:hypothetical protein
MAPERLLVVAPSLDVRRSLAFLLEAEGFDVTATDTLALPASGENWLFNCTVVDDKAVLGPAHESIIFCIKAHPVVYYGPAPQPWLADWLAGTVETPDATGALFAAVRAAIDRARPKPRPLDG